MSQPANTDQVKIVSLLWSSQGRSSRVGLSVQSIVTAGISIADGAGLDSVTMRSVAGQLGVGAMSLYTHVPSKPALLALMHDRVDRDCYLYQKPLSSLESWQERVRHMAEQNRRSYLKHRWQLAIPSDLLRLLGPGSHQKNMIELDAVTGIGLNDRDMMLAVSLVLNHAAASTVSYGSPRTTYDSEEVVRSRSGQSGDRSTTELPGTAENHGRRRRSPRLSPFAALDNAVDDNSQVYFQFGIDRIIDGLTEFIAKNGTTASG